jgi:4-amino-4-deoxy-L-arabinose transferase-like glycosyltransferase
MKKRKSKDYIIPYIILWLALSILFLDRFPFMHSDESWLSGLSRAMMTQGPGVTEPFFDLLPRYPHAIKLLFHALQMGLIVVFGYGLFTVRLISLLFGAGTLFVFYKLALLLTGKKAGAFVATALLSVDVQFVYASHMARQDIVIVFGILAVVYYILNNISAWRPKNDVVTGAMLCALVGVHPNSLIAALCAGTLYLYFIAEKKLRLRNLLLLVGVTAIGAALFISVSLLLDPEFFSHYARYGSELGATLSLPQKLAGLPAYYAKLFLRIGSTYYLPPIQVQLVLFGICVAAGAVCAFYRRMFFVCCCPLLR